MFFSQGNFILHDNVGNIQTVFLALIQQCAQRGINTVCGLSNVSFGLPARPLVNQTFLGMAMGRGLNMAIANPLSEELMNMIAAGDILMGRDPQMKYFLERFANQSAVPAGKTAESRNSRVLTPEQALTRGILTGNTAGIDKLIEQVLNSGYAAGDILDKILIPAITEVGRRYESKEFFLPQLIQSAETMQQATRYLEPMLQQASSSQKKKEKIILATVKGDIHDIGKNIVAVMLKNYDFEVIDLGKDVPAELILDTAVRENVKLIGLSALMTTPMNAMKDVISLARQRGLDHLKFMVGGAVIDQNFADEIGAVYAADPMGAVRAAKELLNLQ